MEGIRQGIQFPILHIRNKDKTMNGAKNYHNCTKNLRFQSCTKLFPLEQNSLINVCKHVESCGCLETLNTENLFAAAEGSVTQT